MMNINVHSLLLNKHVWFVFRRLGHKDVFDMIYKHKLLQYIQDNYLQLMEIDNEVSILPTCHFKLRLNATMETLQQND